MRGVAAENGFQGRRGQNRFGPRLQFLFLGLVQFVRSPGGQGAKAAHQLFSKQFGFAFQPSLLPSFQQTLGASFSHAYSFHAGDISHFSSLLNRFNLAPNLLFQIGRQPHQPIQNGK